MRTRRDEQFDEESARFALRHCCEHCGYFDPRTGGCCHFWPNAEHRLAYYQRPGPEVVFCKEFELE